MARVAIDSRHLNELPNLCVKTGEPTGTTGRQDFADIPGWTLLLIFWGVVPFLIAAGLARRKITVELPASEETLRHIRRVELAAVAGLVVGVGLLIAAVVSQESGFAWSGIAVVLITLLAATGGRNVVWVTGGSTTRSYGSIGSILDSPNRFKFWHSQTSPPECPQDVGRLACWWSP
jgi:hypothetical protein